MVNVGNTLGTSMHLKLAHAAGLLRFRHRFFPSNVVIKAELISASYQQQLDMATCCFVQSPTSQEQFESSRKWTALLLSPKNIPNQISEFFDSYNKQYSLRRDRTNVV